MTTLRQPNLKDIYAPIEGELKEFSTLLSKELSSQDVLISEINGHLLKTTGKFLRPVLTLLTANAGGRCPKEVIRLAVAIELIHTATLVHDDIIDDSKLRRNQPTVYSRWGREISIVAGDYLYAKAFCLLADLEDRWVNSAFARCAHVMCEGEMKQIEKRSDFLMKEEEYLTIIHQKTAALFQAACAGGMYFSGANPAAVEALGSFGFELGMAFQIVDDCLDLIGQTENLGKTIGLDINKSDVTLPLLYLFQDLDPSEQQILTYDMNQKNPTLFDRLRRLAIQRGAVEKAFAKARSYSEKALGRLSALNDSSYKESLSQLVVHCIERVR